MTPTQLSQLIDQIYEAAFDPYRWQEVALAIQSVIGGHTVNFAIENTAKYTYRYLFTNGATNDDIAYYCDNVMAHDELTESFNSKPTGTAYLTQNEWSMEKLNSFYAYQAFYKDIGSTYFIGGEFYRSEETRAYISVARSHLDPIFTQNDVQTLQLLLPHLKRSLCIGLHLLEKEAQINSLKGSLNHLNSAVILLSAQGTISHANAAAEPFLTSAMWNNGYYPVALPDSKANRQLQIAISRILTSDKGCEPSYIHFQQSGESRAACCLPWSNASNQHYWVGENAKCLITINTCRYRSIQQQHLQQLYGLSTAESKVLCEFLNGKSAKQVAQALYVSEATVRFHIRNILTKTRSSTMLEASTNALKYLSTLAV